MATLAVSSFAPVPAETPNRSKIQQAIHESTAALVEQLKAGKSEALTAYLTTMARFHNYSFGNQLMIARQKPTATQVAGFHKWLEFHRYVRKGEKGIRILAPMVIAGKRKAADTDNTSEAGPRLIGFKFVFVFDIAQTDGEDLPDFDIAPKGDPGDMFDRLKAHIEESGIPVLYDATIAPARGLCTPKDIKLLPDMSPAENFGVSAHEYGHALLHHGPRRKQTTETIRECEAEAVSFIVSTACGLDYGTTAADYIQMYDGNADTLAESLQHIQSAASTILEALGI